MGKVTGLEVNGNQVTVVEAKDGTITTKESFDRIDSIQVHVTDDAADMGVVDLRGKPLTIEDLEDAKRAVLGEYASIKSERIEFVKSTVELRDPFIDRVREKVRERYGEDDGEG